jgi:phospholipid/cholesterol/gamma-HCH transport system substrate-binding protein
VNINQILDLDSRNHIKSSIASLDGAMVNLERLTLNSQLLVIENRKSLRSSMENVVHVTKNFSSLSDTLVEANIGELLKKVDATISNLNSISMKIDNADGTIGKFVNDPAVYDNLDKATKELGELLEDLKLHPKRYVHVSVFGKKEKEYVANDTIESK